jgi:hypothetical protein
MFRDKFLKRCGIVTLFLFVFFVFSADIGLAQEDEDVLIKARRLYQEGDYEGSIKLLGDFIEKLKAMVKQKKNVAEAFYLLAKIYFEVGDDAKVDENLEKVFDTYPAFSMEETNFSFKERVEKVKARMKTEKVTPKPEPTVKDEPEPKTQPKVIEQPQPKKKKKKFPVLLVVGGVVVVAALVLLLGKKKKKEEEFDIRGRWTLNWNLGNQSGTDFLQFSGNRTNGTFVDHLGNTGTYTVNGRNVVIEYDDTAPVLRLTGTFSGKDSMSGVISVGNITGSWNATRGVTSTITSSVSGLKSTTAN